MNNVHVAITDNSFQPSASHVLVPTPSGDAAELFSPENSHLVESGRQALKKVPENRITLTIPSKDHPRRLILKGPRAPPSPAHDDRDADDHQPTSPGPVSPLKAGKRKAPPGVNALSINSSTFLAASPPPEQEDQPPEAPNSRYACLWPKELPSWAIAASKHARNAAYLRRPRLMKCIPAEVLQETVPKIALEMFPEAFYPVSVITTSDVQFTHGILSRRVFDARHAP